MTTRRQFITLLGGAAIWPVVAHAQQAKMPVVGFLNTGSRGSVGHLATAVRRGLAEVDLVEGRNVLVEERWAENQSDRLPVLAADLARRRVAVIVCNSTAAQAARRANTTTPIVFIAGDDPVRLGLVESLNRPGGNMTGVYVFSAALEAKRLGLLRDVVPRATTMGVLIDPDYLTADTQSRDVQEAAARLGVQLVVLRAHSDEDIEAAFATLVQQHAAALLVGASPFFNNKRDRLVALAAHHGLPAAYEWREFAMVGGLLSYGNNILDVYRQVGVYAGRILKGEMPTDLPVIQPTKFELVINLKTAKALGLNISGDLLTLADEVIE